MKLYRVPANNGYVWYGTQAEAKVGAKHFGVPFEPMEVPTMPKEAFVNWLNETPILNIEPSAAEIRALAETPDNDNPTCPRCKWDQKSAERYAQQQAKATQTDARIEWIEDEADPWTLGRLAGAVAVRFDKMAKNADRAQS